MRIDVLNDAAGRCDKTHCPVVGAAQADSNQTLLHHLHVLPEFHILDRSKQTNNFQIEMRTEH